MKKMFIVFVWGCVCVSFLFAVDLRLTEVFVDGTDERVEISNMGNSSFDGSFQLSGVKSSLLSINSVSIPSMSTLLVGDNLSMLSTTNNLSLLPDRGLSLGDTNAVNIQLIYNNDVIDTLQVDQATVKSMDNTLSSFQKLYNGGIFSVTPTISLFSSGVIASFFANPGFVYQGDGTLRLPLSVASPVTGDIVSIHTGSVDSGTSSAQDNPASLRDCSTDWSDILLVDEIYSGDIYGQYIELLFLKDWSGSLSFSGSTLSSGFVLPVYGYQAHTRYLIANSSSGFQHTDNMIVIPYLLAGSGTLDIKDVNSSLGYYAEVDITGQSVYRSSSDMCIQHVATVGNPSPGFDQKFLAYLNTSTLTHTVTEIVTGSCSPSSSTTSTSSSGPPILTNTPTLSGFFDFHAVRISLIDYDPVGSDTNAERIGLMSATGDQISLSGWSLAYDGKSYKFLSGSLLSGVEYIRTANFSFVNSRSVCVSLLFQGLVVDTTCYDPLQHASPYLPLSSGAVSSSLVSIADSTITSNYDDVQLDIVSVLYDPDGSDTDRETVTIKLLGATTSILLDDFRLRVGTSNKRIYGTLTSGQTLTLIGNFQMPNSKDTCLALTYGDLVYDEYCYSPVSTSVVGPSQTTSSQQEKSSVSLTGLTITIQDLVYDPDGNDTDRESIVLMMTGSTTAVDLTKLYLRVGTNKRYLHGILPTDVLTTVTGNFQMPNSKATCVDLMQGNYIFDTFCYEPIVSADLATGIVPKPLTTGGISELPLSYSGLHLDWILPNPKGKDIKNTNEQISLSMDTDDMLVFNKRFTIKIGKTSLSLSGYVMSGKVLTITSPKGLSNQAACARLFVGDTEIDRICYPQAKEGLVYYHPRLHMGPQTLPSTLIDYLDVQGVNLSALVLKKISKKVCLTYDGVSIRCINGGTSSPTSAKNKALLHLGNEYISEISTMVARKQFDYVAMDQWRKSYQFLSKKIKNGHLTKLNIYGNALAVTDIAGYVQVAYQPSQEEYVTDQVARIFFGHQQTDMYYKQLSQ